MQDLDRGFLFLGLRQGFESDEELLYGGCHHVSPGERMASPRVCYIAIPPGRNADTPPGQSGRTPTAPRPGRSGRLGRPAARSDDARLVVAHTQSYT